MKTSSVDFIASGDMHGETDVLRAVDDSISVDTLHIQAGDLTRGFDTPGTIDLAIERGIVAVMGNNDVMTHQALFASDPEVIEYIVTLLGTGRYRKDTLSELRAYGVPGDGINYDRLMQYREIVPKNHQEYIRNMRPYALIGDILVVHAGLTSEPVEEQIDFLDDYYEKLNNGYFDGIPPQLDGNRLLPIDGYSGITDLDLIVNGHFHAKGGVSRERSMQSDGRRILLAPPRLVDYNYKFDSRTGEVTKVTSESPARELIYAA